MAKSCTVHVEVPAFGVFGQPLGAWPVDFQDQHGMMRPRYRPRDSWRDICHHKWPWPRRNGDLWRAGGSVLQGKTPVICRWSGEVGRRGYRELTCGSRSRSFGGWIAECCGAGRCCQVAPQFEIERGGSRRAEFCGEKVSRVALVGHAGRGRCEQQGRGKGNKKAPAQVLTRGKRSVAHTLTLL